MNKDLHPRDDIDYMHKKKWGGRRIAGIEDKVDASIQRFKDYIKRVKNDWFQRTKTTQGLTEQ